MKLTLLPPPDLSMTPFGSQGTPHFALSPDGSHIAFVASAAGRAPSLWVRPLASRVAREIPGSDDASSPFWSSNGQSIGFFAQGSVKTIGLSGERPTTLGRVTDPAGGAWSGDVILMGDGSGPVTRMAATGGPRTDATERTSGTSGGQRWPQFLPDGRHFIFTERGSSVRLGVLDSTATTELLDSGGTPVDADTGHLLFVQKQRLMAQAVDRSWRPVGTARQIMDDVRYAGGSGFPPVSIAAGGLLAYWDGTTVSTAWGWFDGKGNPIPAIPAPTDAFGVRIAPDGQRVAYVHAPRDGSGQQVWFLESGGRTARFTYIGRGASSPVWSDDGRDLLFTSIADRLTAVFRQPTSGLQKEQPIAKLPGTEGMALGNNRLVDWSRDRRHALFEPLGARNEP
jgi:Tol biopolymer transport system component